MLLQICRRSLLSIQFSLLLLQFNLLDLALFRKTSSLSNRLLAQDGADVTSRELVKSRLFNAHNLSEFAGVVLQLGADSINVTHLLHLLVVLRSHQTTLSRLVHLAVDIAADITKLRKILSTLRRRLFLASRHQRATKLCQRAGKNAQAISLTQAKRIFRIGRCRFIGRRAKQTTEETVSHINLRAGRSRSNHST